MEGRTDFSLLMYQKLYSRVAELIPALHTEPEQTQFQFPLVPMRAAWGDGPLEVKTFEAFRAGDRTPAEHGPFYRPGGSVNRRFRDWVNQVIFVPERPDAEHKAILATLGILYERRRELMADAQAEYRAWAAHTPAAQDRDRTVTLEEWLPLFRRRKEFVDLEAEIGGLTDLLARYAGRKDRALIACRQANKVVPDNPYMALCHDRQVGVQYLAGETIIGGGAGSLEKELKRWRAGAGPRPEPIILDEQTPVDHPLTPIVPPEPGDCPFVSLVGDPGESEPIAREMGRGGFSLTIQPGGLALYTIDRPGWFDASLLPAYREEHLADEADCPESYFDDESGWLTLIPAQILVGWNPTISLTLPTDRCNLVRERLEGGAGLRVGPFVSSEGTRPVISALGDQTRILFPSASPAAAQPVIIGFRHDVCRLSVPESEPELELAGTHLH